MAKLKAKQDLLSNGVPADLPERFYAPVMGGSNRASNETQHEIYEYMDDLESWLIDDKGVGRVEVKSMVVRIMLAIGTDPASWFRAKVSQV